MKQKSELGKALADQVLKDIRRQTRRHCSAEDTIRIVLDVLTRYKGPLKLKDWALTIAKRSTLRKARIAIIMHAMLRHGMAFRPT